MPKCPSCGHSWELEREFIDSAGSLRRGTQWGFNAFVTEEGARNYVRSTRRRKRGETYRIWQLPDGTFDYSFGEGPPHGPAGPINDAELVSEETT